MIAPAVDPKRLDQEWTADRDVLAALASNGDIASIPRTVDVSFIGSADALEPVADAAEDLGFEFIQLIEEGEGGWRLDFDTEQTVEPQDIKALTRKCLEIEATYPGIEYDGWGCVATTGAND